MLTALSTQTTHRSMLAITVVTRYSGVLTRRRVAQSYAERFLQAPVLLRATHHVVHAWSGAFWAHLFPLLEHRIM